MCSIASNGQGSQASSRLSLLRWTEYERHLSEYVPPDIAEAELQQLSAAARRVENDINEMDAAAFEISGLDDISKIASCSGQMQLVKCDQCFRIMLAPAFQGHAGQCKGPMLEQDGDWGSELGQGRSRLSGLRRASNVLLDDDDDVPDWDPASAHYDTKLNAAGGDAGRGRVPLFLALH